MPLEWVGHLTYPLFLALTPVSFRALGLLLKEEGSPWRFRCQQPARAQFVPLIFVRVSTWLQTCAQPHGLSQQGPFAMTCHWVGTGCSVQEIRMCAGASMESVWGFSADWCLPSQGEGALATLCFQSALSSVPSGQHQRFGERLLKALLAFSETRSQSISGWPGTQRSKCSD